MISKRLAHERLIQRINFISFKDDNYEEREIIQKMTT